MIRKIHARRAIAVAAVATAAALAAPGVAGAHYGNERGPKRHHLWLTDAQKTCLTQQGVSFAKEDRAKYSDPAERMKLWAALQTCGVVAKPVDNPMQPLAAPAGTEVKPFWWDKSDAARWFAAAQPWRDHDGTDWGRWSGWRDKDWDDDHDGRWGDHDGDRHWGDGDRDGWDHDDGRDGRSWGGGGWGR